MLLATKARFPTGEGPNDAGLSRHHLIARLRGQPAAAAAPTTSTSTRSHEWDGLTPLEETARGVRHARPRGQGALRRLLELLRLASDEGARGSPTGTAAQRYVSQQINYSLQARDAEYELIPAAHRPGRRRARVEPARRRPALGQVPARPGGARAARARTELARAADQRRGPAYDIVDALVEIAAAHGVSAAQVALAWLLGRPGVTSVIVGARTEEQLADNLAAADLALTTRRRAARGGQPAAAALPVLAPGREHLESHEPCRPRAARVAPRGLNARHRRMPVVRSAASKSAKPIPLRQSDGLCASFNSGRSRPATGSRPPGQCRAGLAGLPLRRSAIPPSASWMTRWPARAVIPATS